MNISLGTLPGVVLGAAVRVYALPGPDVFRLLIAALLLPLGLWLGLRALTSAHHHQSSAGELPPRTLTGLALAVGVADGIYGIGGGSMLGGLRRPAAQELLRRAPARAALLTRAAQLQAAPVSLLLDHRLARWCRPTWLVQHVWR